MVGNRSFLSSGSGKMVDKYCSFDLWLETVSVYIDMLSDAH